MPFITKHTFQIIISSISLNEEPYPKKSRLEGKNLSILSKKEQQRLALITEILGSEFIPENRFFLKIKNPQDSFTLVHPEKAPSYHIDKNCPALTKKYKNYFVPIEIQEQGNNSVIAFRKFFLENFNLFITDRNQFFLKTKIEFNLKKVLTNRDFEELNAPNSGKGTVEDFNILDLEKDLDNAIIEAENFKYQNPKNQLTVAKYGNIYKPNLTDEYEILLIAKWTELKINIKNKYVVYTMIKNNPDINIKENFLDALGLNRCSYCHKNNNDFNFMEFLRMS